MSTITVKNLVLSKLQGNKANGRQVTILKGINTRFESGVVNTIMAPNGSGKTTFLNILFGNCDSNTKISGEILYNGKERDYNQWCKEVSFVEQQGYTIIDQSIDSMVKFAINMKKKESKGFCIKDEKLFEIYDALNLTPILHKNINSVSGGERKRAMIAIEMVLMKKILILDEPTSDLDSHLALILVTYLKKIAAENDIMVIITIHQPSDQVFKRLDRILFILEGKTVFSGETSQLESFLLSNGIEKPKNWTISDFVFETFYNKGNFEEFVCFTSNVNEMLNKVVKESELILKSAKMQNKAEKPLVSCKFNLSHAFLLVKRFYTIRLKSRDFYFTLVSLMLMFFIILGVPIKATLNVKMSAVDLDMKKDFLDLPSFDKDDTFYDLINNKIAASSTATANQLANMATFRDLCESYYSIIITTMCFSTLSYSLVANSTILGMKDQLQNEITKGVYTAATLCVTSFMCDLLLFSGFSFLLSMFSIAFRLSNFIDYIDHILILVLFFCLSFTSNLINICLKTTIGSAYIFKPLMYLMKTVGSTTIWFNHLYLFIQPKANLLAIIVRYTLAALIVIFFPFHSLSYLASYRKVNSIITKLDEKYPVVSTNFPMFSLQIDKMKSSLKTSYLEIFKDNGFGLNWAFGLLVFSVCTISCITLLLFSKVFTPRMALKN